jgi:hypothetical protein
MRTTTTTTPSQRRKRNDPLTNEDASDARGGLAPGAKDDPVRGAGHDGLLAFPIVPFNHMCRRDARWAC